MAMIGSGVVILAWLVLVIGGIMFLVAAFSESFLWGIGCILVPFVSLIFLIMHWEHAKKAFFVQLAGIGLLFLGVVLAGSFGAMHRLH